MVKQGDTVYNLQVMAGDKVRSIIEPGTPFTVKYVSPLVGDQVYVTAVLGSTPYTLEEGQFTTDPFVIPRVGDNDPRELCRIPFTDHSIYWVPREYRVSQPVGGSKRSAWWPFGVGVSLKALLGAAYPGEGVDPNNPLSRWSSVKYWFSSGEKKFDRTRD